MLVAAAQPYLAPFAGYFYRIHHADAFVVLDRVQFPRGPTWVTRNRFKNDQGMFWITLPVWKKHLGLQPIDQVRICHEFGWARKHRRSLAHAYGHAPYYAEYGCYLEKMLEIRWDRILDLNLELLHYAKKALSLDTRLFLQSQLSSRSTGANLLIDICRELAADGFLAQAPARHYLDENAFAGAGLSLQYIQIPTFVYPQLWGDFKANLSVFDMLLNCGPKSADIIFGHPARITRAHSKTGIQR
jgi:hypothetical protein